MRESDKISLILHLSDKCNLRCRYCYVQNDNVSEKKTSIFKVCSAIKKVIDFNAKRGTKIILHGGEPLMSSCKEIDDFLNMLVEYAKQNEYKLSFSIQTNGTLINNNWVQVFRKYGVRIGISLDGCNEDQNAYRLDKTGNSVFSKVLDRLDFLKKNEMNPGVIFTVSKKHIGMEREMLNFIQTKQIKCNIRPAFPMNEISSDQNICMNPEEYADFFCNMFDIWFNEAEKYETFYVREFEDIIRKVLGGSKECHSCIESMDCSRHFISMGMDGNCYPCNRLYDNKQFYLGNLIEDTIDNIIKKGYLWSDMRNDHLIYCKDCDIEEFCHGGCPAIAYSVYKDYNERDYFCYAYRHIYLHVKKILGFYE